MKIKQLNYLLNKSIDESSNQELSSIVLDFDEITAIKNKKLNKSFFSPDGTYPRIDKNENLKKAWFYLYELEYKYSMLKNRTYLGAPKRKENMLNLYENSLNNLISYLAHSFNQCLYYWLYIHEGYFVLNDKKKFIDFYLPVISREIQNYFLDLENLINLFFTNIFPPTMQDSYFKVFKKNKSLIDKLEFQSINKDEKTFSTKNIIYNIILKYDDVINIDKNEFIQKLKNNQDIKKYIDFNMFNYYFIDECISKPIEILKDNGSLKYLEKVNATNKRFIEALNKLKNIDSKPLNQKIILLNQAKQIYHTNGSINQWYNNLYGFKFPAQEDNEETFSNFDPKKEGWDGELKDIGVEI